MKKGLLIALGALYLLPGCNAQEHALTSNEDGEYPYTNELIHESSPYLLQHAHNPVNWYPWGDKALQKAKDEGKMLIISVGYSACHWCHVMEHESFEDTTVARLMNENFVCIKVDREERPDVDQVYMNAAQLITGGGGWPLNALALPDGKPFFAGTYYPKENWVKLLNYFIDMYANNPASIVEQAEKVTAGIQSSGAVSFNDVDGRFSQNTMDDAFYKLRESVDDRRGGRDGSPKFPMPSIWEYALQYSKLANNKEALTVVNTTLENMAYGGIYDHVGGGFARYSTDADWHVPHFEKMLYDNAQLVSLYTHAWQETKNPLYKKVVYETLEFIERELTSTEGGFYSSLDADSEGEEGKFYVWTAAKIERELGETSKLFMDYYNVQKTGNWEHGKNILFRNESDVDFAKNHNKTVVEIQQIIEAGKATLLKARSQRVRPGLDDKQLTSWNALMLRGYAQAYRAFGEKKFLKSAEKNANFLLDNAINKQSEITRNYKDGKSSITGFLDDYAFVISSFIELYQATFDEQWLTRANALTEYATEHFFDSKSGMFFYTDNHNSNLVSRKMEVSDNVIPGSNSEMAMNLFFLGHYLYNDEYVETARQMLVNVQTDVHENVYFYSNWGRLEAFFVHPPFEVAIVGKDFKAMRQQFDRGYNPFVLFYGGDGASELSLLEGKLIKGQTTIYVCRNRSCKAPVTSVAEAQKQLK
jgi:uncharacterized protein YyaL (SSP411 family)